MNEFLLTVLFSITTIILLSNSVVSRLIPIKNAWKVSDNTILECKVFNGAISKCHVKSEPATIYKFTDNTIPASSLKPTTTSTTTQGPTKSHRGRLHSTTTHRSYPNIPNYTMTTHQIPLGDHNAVYCECSDFFCKLDKFIGSRLNECNKYKDGVFQHLPDVLKDKVGAAFGGVVAKLKKKVIKPVVDYMAKVAKSVLRSGLKLGKTVFRGVLKTAKVVTSVIANAAKKFFGWLF